MTITPLHLWNEMKNGEVQIDLLKFRDDIPNKNSLINAKRQLEDAYIDTYNTAYYHFLQTAKKLKLNYLKPSIDDKNVLNIYLKQHKVDHNEVFLSFLNHDIEAIEKYIMKKIKPNGKDL